MLSFLKQLFPQLVRWTITKTTQLGNVHQTKNHFQVCALILLHTCFVYIFVVVICGATAYSNEATVERGIKDVTHTKKRTRNILHFPFCILYFWLPYFPGRTFVLQTFLIQQTVAIFFRNRSSAFTPWFQLLYPPPPSLQKESQCFLH